MIPPRALYHNLSGSGENKAALEVAKRDGRALNNGKYAIYGVDEDVQLYVYCQSPSTGKGRAKM